MNKIYLTIIIGIMLISLVFAGDILSSFDKEISLSKDQETQIKTSADIKSINVITTPITCSGNICRAWAKQEGVINSEWIADESYCSKYKEVINEVINQTDYECIEYTDYTLDELQKQLTNYIEGRLEVWADVEMNRSVMSEVKDEGGVISSKELVVDK